MVLILSLPEDLCNDFLTCWLSPTEWTKLDTAFCSVKYRHQLLYQLKRIIQVVLSPNGITNAADARWVYLREMQLRNIRVGEVPCPFPVRLGFITTLELRQVYEGEQSELVIEMLNSCVNLTSLTSYECKYLLSMNLSIIRQLNVLVLGIMPADDAVNNFPKVVALVRDHCSQLIELRCKNMKLSEDNIGLYSDIINNNHKIKVIDLQGNPAILDLIVRVCFDLVELLLTTSHFSLSIMSRLIEQNKNLRNCYFYAPSVIMYGPTSMVRYMNYPTNKSFIMDNYDNASKDLLTFLNKFTSFSFVQWTHLDNTLTDGMIQMFMEKNVHTVKTLILCDCNISVFNLKAMLQRFKKLDGFTLRGELSASDVCELFAEPTIISSLEIEVNGMTCDALRKVVFNCLMLNFFNFRHVGDWSQLEELQQLLMERGSIKPSLAGSMSSHEQFWMFNDNNFRKLF